ncbi:hypothetical protein VNO80_12204 [Phaseolus coccineus]|uniref:Uncharacterized protein n=1 Tax=Phaseolus coccineus TaxID=3886 RepID=A0AAN9NGH4_PHACN
MSDPYERVKGGRLAFKGGILASRSKSIEKGKNKKKKRTTAAAAAGEDDDTGPNHNPTPNPNPNPEEHVDTDKQAEVSEYTIDAAKRMKYDQLFPVEAKKFGYQPKTNFNSVEDALDDRVKKKADRSSCAMDHVPIFRCCKCSALCC